MKGKLSSTYYNSGTSNSNNNNNNNANPQLLNTKRRRTNESHACDVDINEISNLKSGSVSASFSFGGSSRTSYSDENNKSVVATSGTAETVRAASSSKRRTATARDEDNNNNNNTKLKSKPTIRTARVSDLDTQWWAIKETGSASKKTMKRLELLITLQHYPEFRPMLTLIAEVICEYPRYTAMCTADLWTVFKQDAPNREHLIDLEEFVVFLQHFGLELSDPDNEWAHLNAPDNARKDIRDTVRQIQRLLFSDEDDGTQKDATTKSDPNASKQPAVLFSATHNPVKFQVIMDLYDKIATECSTLFIDFKRAKVICNVYIDDLSTESIYLGTCGRIDSKNYHKYAVVAAYHSTEPVIIDMARCSFDTTKVERLGDLFIVTWGTGEKTIEPKKNVPTFSNITSTNNSDDNGEGEEEKEEEQEEYREPFWRRYPILFNGGQEADDDARELLDFLNQEWDKPYWRESRTVPKPTQLSTVEADLVARFADKYFALAEDADDIYNEADITTANNNNANSAKNKSPLITSNKNSNKRSSRSISRSRSRSRSKNIDSYDDIDVEDIDSDENNNNNNNNTDNTNKEAAAGDAERVEEEEEDAEITAAEKEADAQRVRVGKLRRRTVDYLLMCALARLMGRKPKHISNHLHPGSVNKYVQVTTDLSPTGIERAVDHFMMKRTTSNNKKRPSAFNEVLEKFKQRAQQAQFHYNNNNNNRRCGGSLRLALAAKFFKMYLYDQTLWRQYKLDDEVELEDTISKEDRKVLAKLPYQFKIDDMSQGKSPYPIEVVNCEDMQEFNAIPDYVTNYVYGPGASSGPKYDTVSGCMCQPVCKSAKRCLIAQRNPGGKFPYDKHGRMKSEFLEESNDRSLYECNARCLCSRQCRNRVIQHGVKKDVIMQIRKTKNKGYGVFAGADIPKGTFVAEYFGEIVSNDEAETRGLYYDENGISYLFDLDAFVTPGKDTDETLTVDPYTHGNIARYFNHSHGPNLIQYTAWIDHWDKLHGRLVFFATRLIKKGEELTFDYRYPNQKRIPCNCGAAECTGWLR